MIEFKVRKNDAGYFIGASDDGEYRVTPYLDFEPKIDRLLPLESPLRHEFYLAKLFENGFFEFTDSANIEDNINVYKDFYCYVAVLKKQSCELEKINEHS